MNELDSRHEAQPYGIIADLRAENAELRRQLEDFRAGYLRRTDQLLNALDDLLKLQAATAYERKAVTA